MTAMSTEKFLPAFFVDMVEPGAEFASGGLPHHITLFPPVSDEYSWYQEGLRAAIHPLAAFEVETAGADLFGSKNTIPVRRIGESSALRDLHSAITSVLVDTSHDVTYRTPYNPHISVRSFDVLPEGRRIAIGGLAIAQRTESGWKITDKIRLKGTSDETAA